MLFGKSQLNIQNLIVTVTITKSLDIIDIDSFQNCTNSSAITITIPNDTTVNFPIGAEIVVNRDGTGEVTITGQSPCNLRRAGSASTGSHVIVAQYACALIKKVAANEWRLYGG
jgi:hypothetical protein